MALSSSLGDAVRKRKFEILGEELLDVWALDIVSLFELNDLEDLNSDVSCWIYSSEAVCAYVDGSKSGTVTSCHILVQSFYGIGSRHLTVLLVHVVGTRARVVSEPDTEVLDLKWALLVNLKSCISVVCLIPVMYKIPHSS